METYVLADPRTGAIRYVGRTTKGAQKRLSEHMSTALDDGGYMPGWLAELKRRRRRPLAIVIATFDCELSAYLSLRRSGASLFNAHRPPAPKAVAGHEMPEMQAERERSET